MQEEVDLNLILKELREIKQLVQQDLELDRRDLDLDRNEIEVENEIAKEEHVIEQEERNIAEKTALVAADLTGMRYVNLDVWKRMVWDVCDAKRPNPREKDIIYNCALYGGPCRFEICPKNLAIRKE